MKMTIRAVPKFCLSLTHAQVKAIVKTASVHYSTDCQMAASVGGFIYGWLNSTAPVAGHSDSGIECTGTFREMDLLLKILEIMPPSLSNQERGWLDDLRDMVNVSMQALGGSGLSDFSYQVEELPPEQRGPFHKFGLARSQRP